MISSLPRLSLAPPSLNSGDSSRNVMATRREVTCCRCIACFQLYLAGPETTINDRRGNRTSTGDAGWLSSTKVRTVSDSRFNVTSRSPHNQQSSRCGSIADPLSGTYSRLHCSTGTNPVKQEQLENRLTSRLLYKGRPANGPIRIFLFLKFTFGPKSYEKHKAHLSLNDHTQSCF